MPPSSPEPGKEWRPDGYPDLLAGQSLPPPPQQERSRRKRDALLQSALTLFAERGYEQTSIEDIAHHAEVAVGGFYQHFASKRQILLVLMDRLLQEASTLTWEAKSATLPDIRDGIAHLVRQALQVDWAYAGAYRAWREAAVRDPELRALHQQIEAWSARQLALLFQVLLLVPRARQEVDYETLAWELALLLLRLAEIPLEEPDAVVASLTNLIYHGLFTDSPA
jgi:TetR/AcrR family transcriptional repressor of mexJK operon